MLFKQFLVAGCLALVAFASCSKKNNDITPGAAIEGNWVGKYSILSEPYNNYYSFKIRAGGILELQDAAQQKTGEGTWEFHNADTVVTGTYSLLPPASGTYSFIANFNKVTGKLDGTWGTGQQEYGGGYWFMNKTN